MLSRRDIRVTFTVTELVSDRRMRKRDIDLGLVNQARSEAAPRNDGDFHLRIGENHHARDPTEALLRLLAQPEKREDCYHYHDEPDDID